MAFRSARWEPHFAESEANAACGCSAVSTSILIMETSFPSWRVNSQIASVVVLLVSVIVDVTGPPNRPPAVAAFNHAHCCWAMQTFGAIIIDITKHQRCRKRAEHHIFINAGPTPQGRRIELADCRRSCCDGGSDDFERRHCCIALGSGSIATDPQISKARHAAVSGESVLRQPDFLDDKVFQQWNQKTHLRSSRAQS